VKEKLLCSFCKDYESGFTWAKKYLAKPGSYAILQTASNTFEQDMLINPPAQYSMVDYII